MLMGINDCSIFEVSGEEKLRVSGDIPNCVLRLDVRQVLICNNVRLLG